MSKKKRVVIAPASFKGTMSPIEAARAIQAAFADYETELIPLADGGEGCLEPLMERFECQLTETETVDALGRPINAAFGVSDRGIAVIESARAVGLTLIEPSERRAKRAHSRGLGLLVNAAVKRGAKEIWVGLGGSAVADGGLGMLSELGFCITNAEGTPVIRPSDGTPTHCKGSSLLKGVKLVALVDVDNLLLGRQGAQMYMAQKGVHEGETTALDAWLSAAARVLERHCGRKLAAQQGAGAAGGLGMAFDFLGAKILRGGPFFADVGTLDEALEEADLLITGEGRLDAQTAHGKSVSIAIDRALNAAVAAVVVCGRWRGFQPPQGVSVFQISAWRDDTPKQALTRTAQQVEKLVRSVSKSR